MGNTPKDHLTAIMNHQIVQESLKGQARLRSIMYKERPVRGCLFCEAFYSVDSFPAGKVPDDWTHKPDCVIGNVKL